jgi:Ni/Co efflux regulator RcnB
MKYLLIIAIALSSFALSAKTSENASKDFMSIQTAEASSHIDKKKSRRHKKMNKKRKKACKNWARSCYAG